VSIVVLVPTRGRPESVAPLYESFRRTAVLPSTRIAFGVDSSDPCRREYEREVKALGPRRFGWLSDVPLLRVLSGDEEGNLTRATNGLWSRYRDYAIVGTINDDMRFRTERWDRRVTDALANRPGIVYGNDLIHGERLTTSPFMSGAIPAALGWYALPTCEHLYIDDAWREIGYGIEALTYMEDVVVEHLHPAVGKAQWDDGYERANNADVTERDHAAYRAWRNGPDYVEDVHRVKAALRSVAA